MQQQQGQGQGSTQSLSTEPEQTTGGSPSSPSRSMRGLGSYFSKTLSTVFAQGSSSSSRRLPSTLVDELWLTEEGMLRMVVVVFLQLLRPFLLSSSSSSSAGVADNGNGRLITRAALSQVPLQYTQRILSALLALVNRPHTVASSSPASAASTGLAFTDFVSCFKKAPTATGRAPAGTHRSTLAQDIVACDLSVSDIQTALRELSTDVIPVTETKVGRLMGG